MAEANVTVYARERVLEVLTEAELDRLTRLACAAAEQSAGWGPGVEFAFELTEAFYVTPGVEPSTLTVRHRGTGYEVLYYDGQMAETVGPNPSWGPGPLGGVSGG
ncbi:MAG TPA: hypothetical protein VH092_14090 [Urbifossiella sp.]|nr:hypothetical protein [Urbifossiella sp.]